MQQLCICPQKRGKVHCLKFYSQAGFHRYMQSIHNKRDILIYRFETLKILVIFVEIQFQPEEISNSKCQDFT